MIYKAMKKVGRLVDKEIEIQGSKIYNKELKEEMINDTDFHRSELNNKIAIIEKYIRLYENVIEDKFLLTKSCEIVKDAKEINKKLSKYDRTDNEKRSIKYREITYVYKLLKEAYRTESIMQNYIFQYRRYIDMEKINNENNKSS